MASAVLPALEKVGLQLLLEPQSSGLVFRAACNTIGVVYPAYSSFKAIEDRKDPTQDQQWLTYWVIYSLLSLAEGTTDQLLSKLPYYYHGKFALLLWLQLPSSQGAKVLYHNYLRPTLMRFQPKVDVCIDRVGVTLTSLYHLYKVPVDAAVAAVGYAFAQAASFFRWFLDSGEAGSGNSSKKIAPGGAAAGKQFLVK